MSEFLPKVSQVIRALLNGKIPDFLDPADCTSEAEQHLVQELNSLIQGLDQVQTFVSVLAQGNLHEIQVPKGNHLASPYKELHSRLMHLTWQAEQVTKGDYSQRVDFMGEFSAAFNTMVETLEQKEKALQEKIRELEETLQHVQQLEGILPICCHCKRIRLEGASDEDPRAWQKIETYIQGHSQAEFSHGICPECFKKYYPEDSGE